MSFKTVGVRLTNRVAHFDTVDDDLYASLRNFWSFMPPGYRFMPSYKAGGWDGHVSLLSRSRLPAGLFRATRMDAAEALNIKFEVQRERDGLKFIDGIADTDVEDYRHQNQCVRAMQAATVRGGGTILSATGTGKTRIAAVYFSRVTGSCLFVVDQKNLLYQQRQELQDWLGEDVGIVGDSVFDPKRVTVATVQTLHIHENDGRFKKWYRRVDVMVVDELHEQMARRNFDVLNSIEPVAVFGLTATLQMKQKPVRYKVWSFSGPVIFEFPLEKGIDRGVLSKVRVLQLSFNIEDDGGALAENLGVFEYADEIQMQLIENEVKLDACRKITRLLLALGRYEIVLVDRRAHLKALEDLFRGNTPYGVAKGGLDESDRTKAIEDFEAGITRLILATKVFKKGVNIKRVDVIMDLAELKSKNDAVQKLGRVLRLHAEKFGAFYIDFGTHDPSCRYECPQCNVIIEGRTLKEARDKYYNHFKMICLPRAGKMKKPIRKKNRFAKAADSRRRALKAAGMEVTNIRVTTAEQALQAVKKFVGKKDV